MNQLQADFALFEPLVAQSCLSSLAHIHPLQAHASGRSIYRLELMNGQTVIAVKGMDLSENRAFLSFAGRLAASGLPVPRVIAASDDQMMYLQEDLGDVTLRDLVQEQGIEQAEPAFIKALDTLAGLAQDGLSLIDTSYCYEGVTFDAQAVVSDVAYFKEQYLSEVGVELDQKALEQDAKTLARFASGQPLFFMHRDYQSRNIMMAHDKAYAIDFQAGRAGPLAYDLASLLNQSSLMMPYAMRERLVGEYLDRLRPENRPDQAAFEIDYWVYSLARKLQNLGAYGRHGLRGGQDYFRRSIAPALDDIRYFLSQWPSGLECPDLKHVLKTISRP